MDVTNGTTIIALIAIIPVAYYLILPSILDLLTPKPLPGIPYRKGRQYPFIGDGLDAGKWLAAQTTITQWLDGCAKAFIYGGKELGAEWGVLNGSKSPKEQLAELERPDRKRSSDYEGISQLMFGLGHGSRQVIVTDIEGKCILVSLEINHLLLIRLFCRDSLYLDQANVRIRTCRVCSHLAESCKEMLTFASFDFPYQRYREIPVATRRASPINIRFIAHISSTSLEASFHLVRSLLRPVCRNLHVSEFHIDPLANDRFNVEGELQAAADVTLV